MWKDNQYIYSTRTLRGIAHGYKYIYSQMRLSGNLDLLESKADFDMALNAIGKGHWTGEIGEFKAYRYFGRLQRIIIAEILGVTDYELAGVGFWDIPRLRGYAYYLMAKKLNGG